jgi:hypothetical protein
MNNGNAAGEVFKFLQHEKYIFSFDYYYRKYSDIKKSQQRGRDNLAILTLTS